MRQVIGYSWTAIVYPALQFSNRIVFVVLVCLLSCESSLNAEPLHVHVVLSEHAGAYQEFSDALRHELNSEPIRLSFDEVATEEDVNLIVAVGMKSVALLTESNKPVLSVFVPKASYDKLPKPSALTHSSAIYLDQPIERQSALLLAAIPRLKRVGVLYTSPPPELASLRRLVAEKGIQLFENSVGRGRSLQDALEDVLEKSEVLLVLPDTEIYNAGTIRNILLSSYRKQVPLIGISQSYVNAGALCAIYSTPKQIALQAAEAIKEIARTGKLPPSQYPKEFEVSVNMQVARSLGLAIKDTETLRNEVRRVP